MELRLHFTADDLARTRIAAGPDPLWESVLSLHQLRSGQIPTRHTAWQQRSRTTLRSPDVRMASQVLGLLVPNSGDFPDFLTPGQEPSEFGEALDLMRATPTPRVRHDLTAAFRTTHPDPWLRSLADGDRDAVDRLAGAMSLYHRSVIRPHWEDIRRTADADRARRVRDVSTGGTERLLAGLPHPIRWEYPVLTAEYPVDKDVHLDGRGLLLVPSYFCDARPVTLIDPELRPVLVYQATRSEPPSGPRYDRLAALLGATRANALFAVREPRTTTELAHQLGTSVPSASRHAAVLRDAGLIVSVRSGKSVLHVLTPLGQALLKGDHPGTGPVEA